MLNGKKERKEAVTAELYNFVFNKCTIQNKYELSQIRNKANLRSFAISTSEVSLIGTILPLFIPHRKHIFVNN